MNNHLGVIFTPSFLLRFLFAEFTRRPMIPLEPNFFTWLRVWIKSFKKSAHRYPIVPV